MRAFYKFLQVKKKIEVNPVSLIKSLKTAKRLPVYVEEKPMENLFADIVFAEDFEGLRDKLLLEMLYGTGIRLSINVALLHVVQNGCLQRRHQTERKQTLDYIPSDNARRLSRICIRASCK